MNPVSAKVFGNVLIFVVIVAICGFVIAEVLDAIKIKQQARIKILVVMLGAILISPCVWLLL